jgi:signal transduction histidine kinase
MSREAFMHYPLLTSEGPGVQVQQGPRRPGRVVHSAIVLLILVTASVGSGLTAGNSATGWSAAQAVPLASNSPATSGSERTAAGAKPEASRQATATGGHLINDGAVIVVCFLAASLWWLVRPPSARLQLQTAGPGQSRPLVVLPSPWNADEQERKQISRDLHDCVGQVLTAANLELSSLRSSDLRSEQLREKLDNVARLNVEALRLVRDLAMGLRPAMLDDVGLTAALEWQLRQFSRRTGIVTSSDFSGELDTLPESHRTCIYRCVQEALTNCARHSKAKNVGVVLTASEEVVTLTIFDDGVGLSAEAITSPGLGILGMHERIEALSGKLSLGPRPEGGTRLHFEILVAVEVRA